AEYVKRPGVNSRYRRAGVVLRADETTAMAITAVRVLSAGLLRPGSGAPRCGGQVDAVSRIEHLDRHGIDKASVAGIAGAVDREVVYEFVSSLTYLSQCIDGTVDRYRTRVGHSG